MTNTKSIFFILGAGASVDSGLKTYRGLDGLYEGKNYEEILTADTLQNNPELIWKFTENFLADVHKATLGPTYMYMKKLIETHPDSFIITQNVDGIASKAFTIPVIELHGNSNYMVCLECDRRHPIDFSKKCNCGGDCRPDVVLFGESLDNKLVQRIYLLIKEKNPEYILIIGTSMQFEYLRTFIYKTKVQKKNRIHINPDPKYKVKDGEIHILSSLPESEILFS